ncbi:hypothetical protein HNQ62_002962 [Sulfurisphaera ohwakuensis]|uniref:Uncharacterized protein n=1 Tax=Sulfurisphaera ohwakuensis TaxID=69656 RepID=A0A7J9RW03_SULOH|nr:hypothetical protein [Sulfurisphaera ohwakuensis]
MLFVRWRSLGLGLVMLGRSWFLSSFAIFF